MLGDIKGVKENAGGTNDEVLLNNEFLKVSQATPQTITGGIPLLANTRVINSNNQIVDKLYVDQSAGVSESLVIAYAVAL